MASTRSFSDGGPAGREGGAGSDRRASSDPAERVYFDADNEDPRVKTLRMNQGWVISPESGAEPAPEWTIEPEQVADAEANPEKGECFMVTRCLRPCVNHPRPHPRESSFRETMWVTLLVWPHFAETCWESVPDECRILMTKGMRAERVATDGTSRV